jgi:hypothetical protein
MAGSPDPKAGRIVDRHLTLLVPRGEGYQGHSPWLVSGSSHGHPFIANFVLGLCIDQSQGGQKPDAAIIEEKLRATEGPAPMLVRRILAQLVPFERDMLRSLSGDEPLASARVRALQRLANYGLLPPGTMIPAEATE